MAIITLLTDFGLQDEYIGVLKGVILGIHPHVTLVDVNHHIPPQHITAAGHTLRSAYGYFPADTLHLAIVDPGVGSMRRILAAQFDGHLFMAPDNGLLPMVWGDLAPEAIVQVENKALFRHPVSRTFHGRDIFAPVAAQLAKMYDLTKRYDLSELGRPVTLDQVQRREMMHARSASSGELVGEVVSVDRFGNLITNIEADQVDLLSTNNKTHGIVIDVEACRINGVSESYHAGDSQKPMALIGSRDCIEIAVNRGNAARLLGASLGTRVSVKSL